MTSKDIADALAARHGISKADARTQVVAGTNVYLAGQASVGGRVRPVSLVLYQPLSGASTLSWVSLGEAK